MLKRGVLVLLSLVLLILSFALVGCNKNTEFDNNENENNTANDNNQLSIKDGKLLVPSDISLGDYLVFGTYEQDNDLSNGPEDIEWLVISDPKYADDIDIMVISRYVLDCQPYHSTETSVTWETCTLRSWLNNEFLNTAFSAEEQEIIINSEQTANPNFDYPRTNQGNNTYDKVFLLHTLDLTVGAFSEFYDEILGIPTNYALSKGLETDSREKLNGKYACEWWLRTAGISGDHVATVNGREVSSHGPRVNVGAYYLDSTKGLGVRPALVIKIEKSDSINDNLIKGTTYQSEVVDD